jgi:hypothetical protein
MKGETLIKNVNQFRNAVSEFAQHELAPLAAQIDKTNNSPMVCYSLQSFVSSVPS